jgi:serine protease inhibitor
MDLANFVWVPRGLAVKAEFARSVQEIFQTRVRDADFTRVEEVRQVINYRIENITRGHITELFPRGIIDENDFALRTC